jgi:hypothetical protein
MLTMDVNPIIAHLGPLALTWYGLTSAREGAGA